MSLALSDPPHVRRSGRALTPFRRTLAALVCAALVVGAGLLAGGPRASAAGETTFTTALDTQVSTFNPFIAYFDGELTGAGQHLSDADAAGRQARARAVSRDVVDHLGRQAHVDVQDQGRSQVE